MSGREGRDPNAPHRTTTDKVVVAGKERHVARCVSGECGWVAPTLRSTAGAAENDGDEHATYMAMVNS